jgi:hypothetical protein
MTLSYLASFDIVDSRHSFGTVRFVKFPVGEFTLDITTDVANGVNLVGDAIRVFNHYPTGLTSAVAEDAEASTGLGITAAVQSWGTLFQQRMQQAAQAAVWGSFGTLTCTYNVATQRYTFTYGGSPIVTIEFSTTATARLFGFSGNFSGSSNSISGTLTPSFVIVPSLRAVTTEGTDGPNYEPTNISMQAVSEYGSVFGLTRAAAPLLRDWTQQSEPKAKALRLSATSSHPFTHQELFEKCSSVHTFVVTDGFGDGKDYVFKLRADASTWSQKTCKRAGGEMDDALFDVRYEAQVLGVFP